MASALWWNPTGCLPRSFWLSVLVLMLAVRMNRILSFPKRSRDYALGAPLNPQPRVVIVCPDRNNVPWELSAPFGLSIRKAAETLDRRIAFVASADLGHAHDAQGPYGYDIASKEFDTALIDAVTAQDIPSPLGYDLHRLNRASTTSYGQIPNPTPAT